MIRAERCAACVRIAVQVWWQLHGPPSALKIMHSAPGVILGTHLLSLGATASASIGMRAAARDAALNGGKKSEAKGSTKPEE
jgi:hypothetical protein